MATAMVTDFRALLGKGHYIFFLLIGFLCLLLVTVILLDLPFLRQAVGFCFLSFVPGFIIYRIINYKNFNVAEVILFSLGLSLLYLMTIGLLLSVVSRYYDYNNIFSLAPLTGAILSSIIIMSVILAFLEGKRNFDFYTDNPIVRDISASLHRIRDNLKIFRLTLLIFLIPLLGILGPIIVNVGGGNQLLYGLIVLICLVFAYFVITDETREKPYHVAIFCIGLALLFHISLISFNIVGWDIHIEYYLYRITQIAGSWSPQSSTIGSNSMLSVTVLPVIFSSMLNVDFNVIYKLIDVIIFSFVPLGLFRIYQHQVNIKIAFIAVFFFIANSKYYFSMPGLPRQEIAELFLILLLLLIVDGQREDLKRKVLFFSFGAGLVLSHYAITYVFIILLIIAFLLIHTEDIVDILRLSFNSHHPSLIRISFIGFIVIFVYLWYSYTSKSTLIEVPTQLAQNVVDSVQQEFLSPESREGLKLLASDQTPPLEQIKRVFHISSQLFIGIGVLISVFRIKVNQWNKEFFYLSMSGFVLLIISVLLPQFNAGFNFSRLYHLVLIFLAPFSIIGMVYIIEIAIRIYDKFKGVIKGTESVLVTRKNFTGLIKGIQYQNLQQKHIIYSIITCFFVIYLVLNASVFNDVLHQPSASIAFSTDKTQQMNNSISTYDLIYTYEEDILGASWFSSSKRGDYYIYSDFIASEQILRSYGSIPEVTTAFKLSPLLSAFSPRTYVYLRYANTIHGRIITQSPKELSEVSSFNRSDLDPKFASLNKVYDSAGNQIFLAE